MCSSKIRQPFINTEKRSPASLEKLCSNEIGKHKEIEKLLYNFGPYYSYGYVFRFEKYVNGMYDLLNYRWGRNSKSFKIWFKDYVEGEMEKIVQNKKDLDYCLTITKNLRKKILSFKKIFGVTEEVLDQNNYIISMKDLAL